MLLPLLLGHPVLLVRWTQGSVAFKPSRLHRAGKRWGLVTSTLDLQHALGTIRIVGDD